LKKMTLPRGKGKKFPKFTDLFSLFKGVPFSIYQS
jgi:hypothetical protein